MENPEFNPYQTPQASVERVEPEAPLVLAGRGVRLGAKLLDVSLGAIIYVPMFWWNGTLDRMLQQEQTEFDTVVFTAAVLFAFVVVQSYPLHQWGQSWGKRVLGIRIVDLEGKKPDLLHLLLIRHLSIQIATKVPTLGAWLGLINVLMIFRADRRCFHDLIAGTQVVTGHPAPRAAS